ncbi:DUF4936 family protein [Sphaerotilus natans]|uniref:DUF4936 family protein n=1 Tax=Sphaerotilus natans TaxID=34103 RepID=UPI00406CF7B1
MELYIYYRIAESDAQAFAAELDALVPRLAVRCPGLRSRWLRRPESRDGMLTIMEIHHHPDGLPAAMVRDIEDLLSSWPASRVGPRHVEAFTELPHSTHPDVHRRSCD